jgi:alcohol dehydrogenase class IV
LELADVGLGDLETALLAADAVSDLIGRLGLPRRLQEVGIAESDLHDIAVATVGDEPQLAEVEELLARML